METSPTNLSDTKKLLLERDSRWQPLSRSFEHLSLSGAVFIERPFGPDAVLLAKLTHEGLFKAFLFALNRAEREGRDLTTALALRLAGYSSSGTLAPGRASQPNDRVFAWAESHSSTTVPSRA